MGQQPNTGRRMLENHHKQTVNCLQDPRGSYLECSGCLSPSFASLVGLGSFWCLGTFGNEYWQQRPKLFNRNIESTKPTTIHRTRPQHLANGHTCLRVGRAGEMSQGFRSPSEDALDDIQPPHPTTPQPSIRSSNQPPDLPTKWPPV